jgi:hypothetical protein
MPRSVVRKFRSGLPILITESCPDRQHAAKDLARRWFEDGEARAEVTKLLRRLQLDETAIEAEAFRLRAEDLECLDRSLALEMARREPTYSREVPAAGQ